MSDPETDGPEYPVEPTCPRCGSGRWVRASLTGGVTIIRQCVPCGRYSGALVWSNATDRWVINS